MFIASSLTRVHLQVSKNSSRILFDLSTNLTQMGCSTWWLSTRMVKNLAFFTSSIRSLCSTSWAIIPIISFWIWGDKYYPFLFIRLSKCSWNVWFALTNSLLQKSSQNLSQVFFLDVLLAEGIVCHRLLLYCYYPSQNINVNLNPLMSFVIKWKGYG